MTLTSTSGPHAALVAPTPVRRGVPLRRSLSAVMLLGPIVLFLVLIFVVPVGLMVRYSFLTQLPDGTLTSVPTLANYIRLATVDLYRGVMFTTLRISLFTTIGALLLAY